MSNEGRVSLFTETTGTFDGIQTYD